MGEVIETAFYKQEARKTFARLLFVLNLLYCEEEIHFEFLSVRGGGLC